MRSKQQDAVDKKQRAGRSACNIQALLEVRAAAVVHLCVQTAAQQGIQDCS
ncbi:MAG: hypothetical protein AB1796_03875 [Bacillota bacterium]